MKKTFNQSKDEIAQLCKYFECNHHEFLASGIKEAHVRQSLIDPFFIALGWDVRNTDRIAPQYREVIPEDSLDVEGQQKAPDYCFRVGTLPKFYAEAKKCGININADPGPAYQLRRYGWSAKVALSILTDFEELGIYDCTMRPRLSDKASRARIQYFHFEEYPDRWREIWDVFSREAVWSGAFDKYTASKRKRGTSEVDVEFLKEIEGWRDTLARNIALRNKDLSSDDLNAAVQRTIDRIVFLRMAEDRGIEPYEQLLKLCERQNIYFRFVNDLCFRADEKYNSGLFHFHKEKGVSETPDQITPKLKVDDKVLKPILQNLYFAYGSPYHFGVLPVEILGTVYERFLGKVIRLTAGHHAKIEEKPEVRKAGGVYYTPAYIVDYIVEHTVGSQIEGKSPAKLAGGKRKEPFRVLDMACGSGSFLLGAYQHLLDHCFRWYIDHNPSRHKKAVYKDARNSQWRLTIVEKKRILITHIFGVDIDPQAVEVSKLSLLLKVLEGETDQTIGQQMQLFHERALPNLANNIKCGNSLIGPDYFTGKLIIEPDEMKRVSPFGWKQWFPEAMKDGGFDCIIGNPPYVRIQTMQEWMPRSAEYMSRQYVSSKIGNYDIYVVFIEKGLSLLNTHGSLAFIMPQKFWQVKYGEALRTILGQGQHVERIVNFRNNQVFAAAFVNTSIMVISKCARSEFQYIEITKQDSEGTLAAALAQANESSLPSSLISGAPWVLAPKNVIRLLEKLAAAGKPLAKCTSRIFQGLKTSADKIFVLDFVQQKGSQIVLYSKQLGREIEVEPDLFHTLIKGTEMRRYRALPVRRMILFPYHQSGTSVDLIDPTNLRAQYPKTFQYLKENEAYLRARERGAFNDAQWYRYGRGQALDVVALPKLITPDLAPRSSFLLDREGGLFILGGAAGGYGLLLNEGLSPEYVMGLLNSRALNLFITSSGQQMESGYYSFEARFIREAPIRPIEPTDTSDKARHDRMISLVESMLALYKQYSIAKSEAQKEVFLRQIDATDADIDRLVYDLYGLTEEEIAIVEGNNP